MALVLLYGYGPSVAKDEYEFTLLLPIEDQFKIALTPSQRALGKYLFYNLSTVLTPIWDGRHYCHYTVEGRFPYGIPLPTFPIFPLCVHGIFKRPCSGLLSAFLSASLFWHQSLMVVRILNIKKLGCRYFILGACSPRWLTVPSAGTYLGVAPSNSAPEFPSRTPKVTNTL